jgi:hypothetical protein
MNTKYRHNAKDFVPVSKALGFLHIILKIPYQLLIWGFEAFYLVGRSQYNIEHQLLQNPMLLLVARHNKGQVESSMRQTIRKKHCAVDVPGRSAVRMYEAEGL